MTTFTSCFPKSRSSPPRSRSEVGTRGIYATNRWGALTGDRARGYVSAYSFNAAGRTTGRKIVAAGRRA